MAFVINRADFFLCKNAVSPDGETAFCTYCFLFFLEGRLPCKQLPPFLPQRGRPVPTCGRCRNGLPFYLIQGSDGTPRGNGHASQFCIDFNVCETCFGKNSGKLFRFVESHAFDDFRVQIVEKSIAVRFIYDEEGAARLQHPFDFFQCVWQIGPKVYRFKGGDDIEMICAERKEFGASFINGTPSFRNGIAVAHKRIIHAVR